MPPHLPVLAPALLPKSLYHNPLQATAATMHHLHGIPLERLREQIVLGLGRLIEIFPRVARPLAGIPDQSVEEYRLAAVKHADETD